jgi:hypothetical protein
MKKPNDNIWFVLLIIVIAVAIVASRGILLIPIGLTVWIIAAHKKRVEARTPVAQPIKRRIVASPGMMRVTDQERDAVTEELARHFQVGRLGQNEFDRRMSYALEARTRDDLDNLLMDLPEGKAA